MAGNLSFASFGRPRGLPDFPFRKRWLGRAVEGRARAGRHREQATGGSRRRAFRRQALLSRRALPDAAKLALPGQRRAQGENLPWPARVDHRARPLAGCSGQARCRPAADVRRGLVNSSFVGGIERDGIDVQLPERHSKNPSDKSNRCCGGSASSRDDRTPKRTRRSRSACDAIAQLERAESVRSEQRAHCQRSVDREADWRCGNRPALWRLAHDCR
jgi:hypothetical protein